MLLVVNIVTCPIGTDCGRSAPVVGLYRQPRLAEGVLLYLELLYASVYGLYCCWLRACAGVGGVR